MENFKCSTLSSNSLKQNLEHVKFSISTLFCIVEKTRHNFITHSFSFCKNILLYFMIVLLFGGWGVGEGLALYNYFSLTTKSFWFLIFFRHLILLFAITLLFHFQNTSCPPFLPTFLSSCIELPFCFSCNPPCCRLNLSSSTSAKKPVLARTMALTSSPGPSWVTALPTSIRSAIVSRSMTRW